VKEITFVLWDADTDGVVIKEDDVVVWQESSWDSFDQYLRHYVSLGEPVILKIQEDELVQRVVLTAAHYHGLLTWVSKKLENHDTEDHTHGNRNRDDREPR
jgi:hypothetical protein